MNKAISPDLCCCAITDRNNSTSLNSCTKPRTVLKHLSAHGLLHLTSPSVHFAVMNAVAIPHASRELIIVMAGADTGVQWDQVLQPWITTSTGTRQFTRRRTAIITKVLITAKTPYAVGADLLHQTAKPMTDPGHNCGTLGSEIPNNTYGYGILDVKAAVAKAREM